MNSDSRADGLSIACARWDDGHSCRGIVQIAHGMGEHIRRYLRLIEALVRAGLVVYGNDHRGHGLTAPSVKYLGDFGDGGFDLLVEDTVRLSLIARREDPGKPLIVLGHSMGSFAAQEFVLTHSELIDGLILSGSGVLDGVERLAASARPGENVLNAPFEPARTPFDWLSRDPSVADAFMNDPLCFPALQPASMQSFLGTSSKLADPGRLNGIRQDLPVYLFSGSEDPVGQQLEGVRILIERYRNAGILSISQDFYRGGRHEMLNEINQEEVRTNLLNWMAAALRW